MSTGPDGGGLGNPSDADRDGLIRRESPEEISPQVPPEQRARDEGAAEHAAKGDIPYIAPTFEEQDIAERGDKFADVISRYAGVNDRPLFENVADKGLLSGLVEFPLIDIGHLPLRPFRLYGDRQPAIDGSEYAQDAFGGFGPGSPEYDSEQRLEIAISDSKSAVSWFRDAVVETAHPILGPSSTDTSFSAYIPDAWHPGVSKVEVRFTKDADTSLISGNIEPHHGALSIPDAPSSTNDGQSIDTLGPARRMLTEHLYERLGSLYGDKIEVGQDSGNAMVELGEGMSLHVDCTNLPHLTVTVNGRKSFAANTRFGEAQPTPRQLERELQALQEHFPAIVEAHADFFRRQLPKTRIEVDYKSPSAEGDVQDAINPQRLATLRQELLATPREDDFKYIGGLDSDIAKLKQAAMGFAHPEAFREFGVSPPRGILLQGPPGTGKTSLAMAFARDAEAAVLSLKASNIKSAFHGETERNIRGVFQVADELVDEGEQVVIFIDELEALAPGRDAFGSSNIDKNVTTELLQAMNVDRPDCIIIAATNAPGMVDPALTNNSSRFSEQLEIALPDVSAREDIIGKLFLKFADKSTDGSLSELFDPAIDVKDLAADSEGLSGADLESAIRKVLFAKAVTLVKTGNKPGPATNGEIYRSIKDVLIGKEKTGKNYLRS